MRFTISLIYLLQIGVANVSARTLLAQNDTIPAQKELNLRQTPRPQSYQTIRGQWDSDVKRIFVRFQIPYRGQSTTGARVTTKNWDATEAEVTSAVRNYWNTGGTNIMLWREFDMSTLQYAGYYSPACMHYMEPQRGLNADNVAISFILSSGTQDLERIWPDTSGWSQTDIDATQGIFGISGDISLSDYAWSTGDILKQAVSFSRRAHAARYDDTLYVGAIDLDGDFVAITMGLAF